MVVASAEVLAPGDYQEVHPCATWNDYVAYLDRTLVELDKGPGYVRLCEQITKYKTFNGTWREAKASSSLRNMTESQLNLSRAQVSFFSNRFSNGRSQAWSPARACSQVTSMNLGRASPPSSPPCAEGEGSDSTATLVKVGTVTWNPEKKEDRTSVLGEDTWGDKFRRIARRVLAELVIDAVDQEPRLRCTAEAIFKGQRPTAGILVDIRNECLGRVASLVIDLLDKPGFFSFLQLRGNLGSRPIAAKHSIHRHLVTLRDDRHHLQHGRATDDIKLAAMLQNLRDIISYIPVSLTYDPRPDVDGMVAKLREHMFHGYAAATGASPGEDADARRQRRHQLLEEEAGCLKAEIQRTNLRAMELEVENESLKRKVRTLDADLADADDTIKRLRTRLADMKDEIDDLCRTAATRNRTRRSC